MSPVTSRAVWPATLTLLALAACGGEKTGGGPATVQKITIQATGDARAEAATYLKQLCPKPIGGEAGKFIGRCGLLPWTIDGQYDVEVAYTIAEDFWGQGLGSEAAQGILQYGFETLKLKRMICLIDPENIPSQRVAEKIGMAWEKTVDGY